MKKIFVLFTFMSFVSFAVNAQTCSHAKKSSTSTSVETTADYAKTVAAAAEMDESIEQKVCAKSGNVSYERKNVCSTSGTVSYSAVQYDATAAKFVNVSPSDMEASEKKASCAAACAKTCSKPCTKPSSSSSSSATESGAKVKMVKSDQ